MNLVPCIIALVFWIIGAVWMCVGRIVHRRLDGLIPVQVEFKVNHVGEWKTVYNGSGRDREVHTRARVSFLCSYQFDGCSYCVPGKCQIDKRYRQNVQRGLEQTIKIYIDPANPEKLKPLAQMERPGIYYIIGSICIIVGLLAILLSIV